MPGKLTEQIRTRFRVIPFFQDMRVDQSCLSKAKDVFPVPFRISFQCKRPGNSPSQADSAIG